MTTYTWNGGTGDWATGSDWGPNGVPGSPDSVAASSGTVTISSNDHETTAALTFSGTAELLINGGSLEVGDGSPGGNPTFAFTLGSAGAVLNGSSGNLTVGPYLNGQASGTVYLEGTGNSLYWESSQVSGSGSGLTVDFADAGQSGTFNVEDPFGGTVQGFQAGDIIDDNYGGGTATHSFGTNSVTVTKGSSSVTIRFSGGTYNSSNVFVDSSGTITTTVVTPAPEVGSATYNASTGALVVNAATGAGTAAFSGTIDPTQLTLTGENNTNFTLTGGTVSNETGSAFTVTLTAADQLAVDGLLDKNGTSSTGTDIFNFGAGPQLYNIAATGSFDVGGRGSSGGVTVSNALSPTITSVAYNTSTGILTLNGTGFENSGAYGGINLGQITLTGKGGNAQAFTFNANDYASVNSSTLATIDLTNLTSSNAQSIASGEKASVSTLLSANGTSASDGTTYNLAATTGWDAGAATTANLGVTVSGGTGAAATISSAAYNASTGVLVVSGSGFSGTPNPTVITPTGQGGASYTLTGGTVSSVTSTSFTVTLTSADQLAVDGLLNNTGTVSAGGTTYNLQATGSFDTNGVAVNNAAITVSNPLTPTITGVAFNATTGVLTFAGTGFENQGATGGLELHAFTIRGQGGYTYQLSVANASATSMTAASATLTLQDLSFAQVVFNTNGTRSSDGTTYNLAATAGYDSGAGTAITTQGVTVSGAAAAAATISSASYSASTGALVVTGSNLTTNAADFTPNALTITGQSGTTYALTGGTVSGNSSTGFTVALSAADQLAVDGLLNKNGTAAAGGTTYNIAAASSFDTGGSASNGGITVSSALAPAISTVGYNAATGVLSLTGAGFENEGATGGLDVTHLTLTGKSGATVTLSNANTASITSATAATVTLTSGQKTSVNALLDANGTSDANTTYNLAATAGWDAAVGAAISTQGVLVQAIPPIVSSIHLNDTSPNGATSEHFTVTFSEAVTGVDSSDFTVTTSDTPGGSHLTDTGVTVTGSGASYTVTVTGVSGDGTVRLDLNATGTGITDTYGNGIAGGFTSGDVATVQQKPVVAANGYATATQEGQTATGAAGAALAGDSDPTGAGLTVVSVSAGGALTAAGGAVQGSYGHLTVNGDGSYSYAADIATAIDAAPSGTKPIDSFTLTVSNGVETATEAFAVTIDRLPVVTAATATVLGGQTLSVSSAAAGVLSGATDADSDTLTVSSVGGSAANVGQPVAGTYGSLTLNADGTYSYAASNAAAIAAATVGVLTDTFADVVSDGHGGTTGSTLIISVVGPNVTVSELGTDAALINATPGYLVQVVDTAAAITTGLATLQSEVSQISGITVTSGTVSVAVTTFGSDQGALDLIAGGFTVTDTASAVVQDDASLAADSNLAAIALTGGTATVAGAFSIGHATSLSLGGSTLNQSGTTTLAGAVSGSGTIAVTGALDVTGTVAGGATLAVSGGGSIRFDASQSGATVSFGAGGGSVKVAAAATLGDTVSGFAAGDTIDLAGVTFSATDETVFTASSTGGTLQIRDTANANAVVATLSLTGNYGSGLFTLGVDGGTGTTLGFTATPYLGLLTGMVETANIPGGTPLAVLDQYNANTSLYRELKLTKLSDGSFNYHYDGGTYFADKSYTSFDNVVSATGILLTQTQSDASGLTLQHTSYNPNGTIYLRDTITRTASGQTDHYGPGSYFASRPFVALDNVTNTAGQLVAQTAYNSDQTVFLHDTVTTLPSGGTLTHADSGSFFQGKSYAAFDNVRGPYGLLQTQTLLDAQGKTLMQTTYNPDGSAYEAYTVATTAAGQTLYHFEGGSFFNSKVFSAFDNLATPNNVLLAQTLDNKDGSHTIAAPGNNLTLPAVLKDSFTLTGHDDTIRFGATGFGADMVTGTTAGEVFSFAPAVFANYTAMSQHVSGTTSAVISDTAGDSLTLNNVATSNLSSTMFRFT